MAHCSTQDPEALQPVGDSGCYTVLAASSVALKTSCSAVSSCMALAFSYSPYTTAQQLAMRLYI